MCKLRGRPRCRRANLVDLEEIIFKWHVISDPKYEAAFLLFSWFLLHLISVIYSQCCYLCSTKLDVSAHLSVGFHM